MLKDTRNSNAPHASQQNGHAEQFMYTVMIKLEACISAFSIADTKLYSTNMSCEKHHIPSPVVQILSTTLHNSIPKHDFYVYGPESLVFCIPVASCSCSFLFRTGCGLVDFQMRQKTRMDWTWKHYLYSIPLYPSCPTHQLIGWFWRVCCECKQFYRWNRPLFSNGR